MNILEWIKSWSGSIEPFYVLQAACFMMILGVTAMACILIYAVVTARKLQPEDKEWKKMAEILKELEEENAEPRDETPLQKSLPL